MTDAATTLAAQPGRDEADPTTGLLFGRVLDGRGGARAVNWAGAQAWIAAEPAAGETLWLHVDRTAPGLVAWLRGVLGASEATAELLVSNETRPRAFAERASLVTVLRGLNLNDGAEPADMIAMQIWADARRVVTFRRRRLQSPRDVLAMIDGGAGPRTAGDLVVELITQLVVKMSVTIHNVNTRIDEMEAATDGGDANSVMGAITDIRRQCLALKRYMAPQHEALVEVQRAAPDWMTAENRDEVRETVDRLRRYLEDLDVSKESVLVLQDDLNNRANSKMNQTTYVLSLVAAIFLPLSFVTGLLGINVGGMPGVASNAAFWITVVLLCGILTIQFLLFRRLKWL
jgi:zinc transporter